ASGPSTRFMMPSRRTCATSTASVTRPTSRAPTADIAESSSPPSKKGRWCRPAKATTRLLDLCEVAGRGGPCGRGVDGLHHRLGFRHNRPHGPMPLVHEPLLHASRKQRDAGIEETVDIDQHDGAEIQAQALPGDRFE